MDKKNKRDIRLGIFIFVGLLFFTIVVLAIGNINKSFTKTITISTIFNQVNGLQPGDNVWFSGVKVGTVKSLQFLKTTQVAVSMNIESKSKEFIPKDASTKISSDGLIGNKIIIIYGGNANAGHIVAGDQLISVSAINTEDVMAMLQENNKNILAITTDFKTISGNIVQGKGSLGKLLTNESLYDNLNTTLLNLKTASDNIIKLTASVNDYANKLDAPGGLANDIATDTTLFSNIQLAVNHLDDLTATANQVAADLKTTAEGINQDQSTPLGVVLHDQQAAENLKNSIQNLESSSEKLNESMTALQHNFLLRGFFRKQSKADSSKVTN